jgi:hypothetical protein
LDANVIVLGKRRDLARAFIGEIVKTNARLLNTRRREQVNLPDIAIAW